MRKRPLTLFALASVAAHFGCDAPTTTATAPVRARSEVVKATGATSATSAASAASATMQPSASTHASTKPRILCENAPIGAGKSLPTAKVDHVEASDARPLGDRITGARDRWTWINFWAAWCGPCKEEIPRLRDFEQRFAKAATPITLAFVSLDDDARQARKFLEGQPATGLRASFWLPDGGVRTTFLEAVKMKESEQLPVQLLFDPDGQLRCRVDGAIEDGDYAQLASMVSHR